MPENDRLVFLRGRGGVYDVLWADYRRSEPPGEAGGMEWLLEPMDQPSYVAREASVERTLYFRTGVWAERDEHEAENHFYARGGTGPSHPGIPAVTWKYLEDMQALPTTKTSGWSGTIPNEFKQVGDILLSDLITVAEFREFMAKCGYEGRRAGDDWTAANPDSDQTLPVGATYADALAFVAWKERNLDLPVRLMTVEEQRAIRPFASEHYSRMGGRDFPWENWPPRGGLRSALVWSEPRFEQPGPSLPEFPPEGGLTATPSRRRWISEENWPPAAAWAQPLPWMEYRGVRFIDAWDVYEWCQAGRVAGRYWEGSLGFTSWGAYKNVKVTFRLAIDADPRKRGAV